MKSLLHFLKPHRKLCIATLLVGILDVFGALMIPTITADMINVGISSGNMHYILQKGILMLLVTIVAGLGALLGSYLCADLSAKLGRDMRNAIYDASLSFSAYDFEQFGTGSMITRTLNDINVIQQSIVWCIQYIVPVPVLCVMGISLAFSIDVTMGVLLLISTGLIILLALLVTRSAASIFGKLQRFLDRMNVVLRENITGVRVIRAFNKEQHEEKRMRKSFEDYAEASIKANRLFSGLESTAFFLINLCLVFILWIGGNRVGAGYMQIGDITAVIEYAMMILFYIVMAQMVIILLPRANVCAGRMNEILSYQVEIQDGTDTMTKEVQKNTDVVHFENVSFQFEDAEEATLHSLNFTCERGKTTAIIGGTGSGKSTIAKLILRFHDTTKGNVYINGKNIRSITQHDLRASIAYVPQKAWLFSGTIADNLQNGNRSATEAEMKQALSVAQSDFVFDMPKGLESHVAQGGANFSGGQRQRLSIARALMKKADLYIFDDSFSALDFKTDAALRKALKNETEEAAVLIIAQRINTILNADRIIVLEDGKAVGIGTHQELMKNCPVYQDIAKSQMKGEAEL